MASRATEKHQFPTGKLVRLLSQLLGIVLFTACVNVEFGSEYREDGSATHSIQIIMSRDDDPEIQSQVVDSVISNLEEQTTEAGLQFERLDTPDETTVRITGNTSEGEEAGAAINSLINATGLNSSPGITAPFKGSFQRETGAVGGSSYTLSLTVNGELLFDSIALGNQEPENRAAMRQALTMSYVATLPGDITDTNGEKVSSHTVRWEIPLDGTAQLNATSSTGGSESAALFIIVGVVAIIIVMLIAAGLAWYFARRNRLTNALGGSAIQRLPGQRTITDEGAWVAARINGLARRVSRKKPDKPADER